MQTCSKLGSAASRIAAVILVISLVSGSCVSQVWDNTLRLLQRSPSDVLAAATEGDAASVMRMMEALQFTPFMGATHFDVCESLIRTGSESVRLAAMEAVSNMRYNISIDQYQSFSAAVGDAEDACWGVLSSQQKLLWRHVRNTVLNVSPANMSEAEVKASLDVGDVDARMIASISSWGRDVDTFAYISLCGQAIVSREGIVAGDASSPRTCAATLFALIEALGFSERAKKYSWFNRLGTEYHVSESFREECIARIGADDHELAFLGRMLIYPHPMREVCLSRLCELGPKAAPVAWAVRDCLQEDGKVGELAERAFKAIYGIR